MGEKLCDLSYGVHTSSPTRLVRQSQSGHSPLFTPSQPDRQCGTWVTRREKQSPSCNSLLPERSCLTHEPPAPLIASGIPAPGKELPARMLPLPRRLPPAKEGSTGVGTTMSLADVEPNWLYPRCGSSWCRIPGTFLWPCGDQSRIPPRFLRSHASRDT